MQVFHLTSFSNLFLYNCLTHILEELRFAKHLFLHSSLCIDLYFDSFKSLSPWMTISAKLWLSEVLTCDSRILWHRFIQLDCKVPRSCGCTSSSIHHPPTAVLDSYEAFVLICCVSFSPNVVLWANISTLVLLVQRILF